jgi:predicted lipoprotein with Yx(FWY)xxD motif
MTTNRSRPFGHRAISSAAVLGMALALAACALPQPGAKATSPAMMSNGVLVASNGMTLYTFDRDSAGKSVCNGQCAANWPPLLARGPVSGDFGLITRDDGQQQVTYKGKPLYYWVKDQKPGDRTGDGVNNVWRVAK